MAGPEQAFVDAASLRVHAAGRSWPFDVDLSTGQVTVNLGGTARTLSPLRWQEKLTLSRYAASPPELLDAALVAHRLSGTAPAGAGAAGAAEQAALVALARWLNGFAGPVSLDPAALARVTAAACRRTGLTPADLADRVAAEVELLAGDLVGQDTEVLPLTEIGPWPATGEPDDGVTSIIIVPGPTGDDDDRRVDAAVPPEPSVDAAVRPAQPADAGPRPVPSDQPSTMPADPPAAAAASESSARPSRPLADRPPTAARRQPLGIVDVRAIESRGAADLPFLAAAPATGAPGPAVPRARLETGPPMGDRLTAPAGPRPAGPAPVRSHRASELAPPAPRPAAASAGSVHLPPRTRPEPGVWRPAALPPRPLAGPLPRSEGGAWPPPAAPAGEGARAGIDLDQVIDAVVAALTDRLDQAVAELGLDPAD